MPNSSSKAMTSSTVSSESAPRSSTNDASSVTFSGSTPSSLMMISLTFASVLSAIVSSPLDVSNHHAAIDDYGLAGNIRRARPCQKPYDRRDIVAAPQAAERDLAQQGLAHAFAQFRGHFRLDVAGCHGIAQDVARRQFLRHRLRQSDQAGLRGGVVRLPLVAGNAHDTRDVDDAAITPAHHPARRRADRVERALQV